MFTPIGLLLYWIFPFWSVCHGTLALAPHMADASASIYFLSHTCCCRRPQAFVQISELRQLYRLLAGARCWRSRQMGRSLWQPGLKSSDSAMWSIQRPCWFKKRGPTGIITEVTEESWQPTRTSLLPPRILSSFEESIRAPLAGPLRRYRRGGCNIASFAGERQAALCVQPKMTFIHTEVKSLGCSGSIPLTSHDISWPGEIGQVSLGTLAAHKATVGTTASCSGLHLPWCLSACNYSNFSLVREWQDYEAPMNIAKGISGM